MESHPGLNPAPRTSVFFHMRAPIFCLLFVPLAASCAVDLDSGGYVEHEEKRFTVDATPDVRLETFDGGIDVRAWDRNEVVVSVEKRGQDKTAVSKIQIQSDQKGNAIHLEAQHPESRRVVFGIGSFRSPSARLVVNVPRQANLIVRTSDGAVLIERVTGHLDIHTGDGRIHAIETAGDLMLETGDGSIQLEDITGNIEARTDDGSMRITGTPAMLRARSGDGSIVLRVRRGAAMSGDWMVTTGDGSISAELPDGFNADIEADPGSGGRARNELRLINLIGGTRDQRSLRGRLGEGGHTLTLRTGDGTIHLTPY